MRRSIGAATLAFALGWTPPAWADPGVAVHVEGEDAAAIERAVGVELAALSPAPAGVLTVLHHGDAATIVFVRDDGRRIERTIRLQRSAGAAVEEIALVAANLARDDASLIVADNPPQPAEPPATEAAPVEAAKEPMVQEQSSVDAAPPAPAAPASARVAPAAVAEQLGVDPCASRAPLLPIAVDFAPFIGMSSSPDVRAAAPWVSLNVVGGLVGGLRGVQVGGAANLVTGPVCGVQIGGALNVGGRLGGLQIGGAVNVAAGDVYGAQMAGAANGAAGDVYGAQIAGAVNVAAGDVYGAQMAGAANVSAGDVYGAQVGAVNVARGRVRGVQIGVVNVAETTDLSLGVVNVAYKGRFHVDVWSNLEAGMLLAAVKNGGDHWHSIYGVGTRLTDPGFIGLLGFGAHVRFSERFFLDVDALAHVTSSFSNGKRGTPLLQARPIFGVNLVGPFALYGGAAFNALLTTGADESWAPDYALDVASVAHLWPGAVFGAQMIAE
ncbi:MAG: hypothetical protein U0414_29615 [Polyangiaceae bacterium]